MGGRITFDSSTGFNLPDGSWVRWERWKALTGEAREGFTPICPGAAFEVCSPSDSLAELRAKMCGAYMANGAWVTVLADPQARSVEVCWPGREVERHEDPSGVSLDPELTGFT